MSTAASVAWPSDEILPGRLCSTWLFAKQHPERALISGCSANLQLVLLSVAQALGSPIDLPSVRTGSLQDLEPSRSWSQHVRKD